MSSTQEALPRPVGPAVVAVVVDDSVAALGAARWAVDAARRRELPLVAVLLTPDRAGGEDDAQAALGRVAPTLARSGTPLSVLACPCPVSRSARRAAAETAAAVRRSLAALDVALLVCPAPPGGEPHRLVDHLAQHRQADLLAVPSLAAAPVPPPAAADGAR